VWRGLALGLVELHVGILFGEEDDEDEQKAA
jgi:hypothetical protein